jgi:hypothetical protein
VVQDGIEFGHGEIVDHPVITAGKDRESCSPAMPVRWPRKRY